LGWLKNLCGSQYSEHWDARSSNAACVSRQRILHGNVEKVTDYSKVPGLRGCNKRGAISSNRVCIVDDARLTGLETQLEKAPLAMTSLQPVTVQPHMRVGKSLFEERRFPAALNPNEDHTFHGRGILRFSFIFDVSNTPVTAVGALTAIAPFLGKARIA
jgi:hypothetical protein